MSSADDEDYEKLVNCKIKNRDNFQPYKVIEDVFWPVSHLLGFFATGTIVSRSTFIDVASPTHLKRDTLPNVDSYEHKQ